MKARHEPRLPALLPLLHDHRQEEFHAAGGAGAVVGLHGAGAMPQLCGV